MTPKIKEQILAIRSTGETNMFDVNTVMRIAMRDGFYELVDYLQDHKSEYAHFILTGEEDEEDGYENTHYYREGARTRLD